MSKSIAIYVASVLELIAYASTCKYFKQELIDQPFFDTPQAEENNWAQYL